MKILGAGMAGLIAANMLRKYEPTVVEAQSSLPNNHGALLRFRSSAVAEASGQTFRQVHVVKGIRWKGAVLSEAPIPAINMYSRKVTGAVLPRSVMNMKPSERWIAPDDFTEVLARGVNLSLGIPATGDLIRMWAEHDEPIISTIPMPALMRMMAWTPRPEFTWQPIWSVRSRIRSPSTEIYQTIYYPEPEHGWYRASITADLFIIETLQSLDQVPDEWIQQVLEDFGLGSVDHEPPSIHHQQYGKLLPTSEPERQAFITTMTDRYRLYSLGRFGTWRQILLDDLVHDVQVIKSMINSRKEQVR